MLISLAGSTMRSQLRFSQPQGTAGLFPACHSDVRSEREILRVPANTLKRADVHRRNGLLVGGGRLFNL